LNGLVNNRSTELHGLHRRTNRAKGGDDDDGGGVGALFDLLQNMETVHSPHLHIGHYQVGRESGEGGKAFFSRTGGDDGVSSLLKVEFHHPPQGGIIIDDEYRSFHSQT